MMNELCDAILMEQCFRASRMRCRVAFLRRVFPVAFGGWCLKQVAMIDVDKH